MGKTENQNFASLYNAHQGINIMSDISEATKNELVEQITAQMYRQKHTNTEPMKYTRAKIRLWNSIGMIATGFDFGINITFKLYGLSCDEQYIKGFKNWAKIAYRSYLHVQYDSIFDKHTSIVFYEFVKEIEKLYTRRKARQETRDAYNLIALTYSSFMKKYPDFFEKYAQKESDNN